MEIRGEPEAVTVYQAVGGTAFFVELIEHFYTAVEADPLLRDMYPADLTVPKEHTSGFLVQYFGGPTTYSDERGHPRLRMRHAPFVIGQAERDAWVRHMFDAVDVMAPAADVEKALKDYFEMAATHMINAST